MTEEEIKALKGENGPSSPRRKRARVATESNTTAAASDAEKKPEKRTAPTDPDEFRKATALFKLPAQMMVTILSKASTAMGEAPADNDEKEMLTTGYSGMLYEQLESLSFTAVAAIGTIGFMAPRLISYFDKKAEARKQQMMPQLKAV